MIRREIVRKEYEEEQPKRARSRKDSQLRSCLKLLVSAYRRGRFKPE